MKRLLCLVGCLLLMFSCTPSNQKPSISGTVNFIEGVSPDSIYIGLYRMSLKDDIRDPILFSAQTVPTFSFDVEPGKYTLAVFAFGYEHFREIALVPDNQTHLMFNVKLPPIGIKPVIEKVKVIGEYCDWDEEKTIELDRERDIWIMKDPSILGEGKPYKFLIDDLYLHDLSKKKIKFLKKFHSTIGFNEIFNNIYNGGEIKFDPSLYKNSREKASAKIKGFDLYTEFKSLMYNLDEFTNETRRTSNKEDWEKVYEKLNTLEKKYDPFFKQIFIERRIMTFISTHPVSRKIRKLRHGSSPDSSVLHKFYKSESVQEFYETNLNLMKQLNPKSYLSDGKLWRIYFLGIYAKESPTLMEKLKIPEDYFYNFLIDFVAKSPNKRACSDILFRIGSGYARMGEFEKATSLLNLLKREYADDYYIGQRHAEKLSKRLKSSIGAEAPEFTIETLSGDTLKLSDFRGKFVFVDFWGTWCVPCLHEIPNLRKLANTIPNGQLQIIGIAKDNLEQLTAFLEKEKLPYPNSIASENLLAKYGIIMYPTNFLIAPDGRIIDKYIRGEKIVELIQEKMDAYIQKL